MGKYRNGRRVAVQGGRALLEKVENLVRGGAIQKPVWFDAMLECPPPQLPFRCVPCVHACAARAAAVGGRTLWLRRGLLKGRHPQPAVQPGACVCGRGRAGRWR